MTDSPLPSRQSDSFCQWAGCDREAIGQILWNMLSPANPTDGAAYLCAAHGEVVQKSAFSSYWRTFQEEVDRAAP